MDSTLENQLRVNHLFLQEKNLVRMIFSPGTWWEPVDYLCGMNLVNEDQEPSASVRSISDEFGMSELAHIGTLKFSHDPQEMGEHFKQPEYAPLTAQLCRSSNLTKKGAAFMGWRLWRTTRLRVGIPGKGCLVCAWFGGDVFCAAGAAAADVRCCCCLHPWATFRDARGWGAPSQPRSRPCSSPCQGPTCRRRGSQESLPSARMRKEAPQVCAERGGCREV